MTGSARLQPKIKFMIPSTDKKTWNENLGKEAQARDSLKEIRLHALKNFEESGFPTQKDEAWRYTSTAFIASREFHFSGLSKIDAHTLEHLRIRFESFKSSARLVFIDGWFMPMLSDIKPLADTVDFSSMRELAANRPNALAIAPEKLTGLAAMNAALFQDGVWLHVHPGAKPEAPLLIYFLQNSTESNRTAQLRHVISLGEQAVLKIVEWHDHLSDTDLFLNQEMQISLAPSAQLEHLRLQQAGKGTWLRSASEIRLEGKTNYHRLDLDSGAKVSRNEINVEFAGSGAVCSLKGIGLGAGERHLDTQVMVNHAVPAAASDQSYRNLLSGKSRAVFGGRVRVCREAQKTDARQVHKTLLLSDEARADTKPQLEIDADDVQCSHGAAIGQLDEDSLFYLRSRGISRANAEKMLAAGFVEKILDSIACGSLRSFFQEQLKITLIGLFSSSSEPRS